MALPLGQTKSHRLNHLIVNEVSIPKPKLIMVAER
jgi:hypothetical protein